MVWVIHPVDKTAQGDGKHSKPWMLEAKAGTNMDVTRSVSFTYQKSRFLGTPVRHHATGYSHREIQEILRLFGVHAHIKQSPVYIRFLAYFQVHLYCWNIR